MEKSTKVILISLGVIVLVGGSIAVFALSKPPKRRPTQQDDGGTDEDIILPPPPPIPPDPRPNPNRPNIRPNVRPQEYGQYEGQVGEYKSGQYEGQVGEYKSGQYEGQVGEYSGQEYQGGGSSWSRFKVITQTSPLNIRKSPSTSSQSVGSLPKGSIIYARPSSTTGWHEYSANGSTLSGYVSSGYIQSI